MHKKKGVKELISQKICSVYRACHLLGLKERSYYYKERGLSDKKATLIERIKHLSLKYPRYGYRRIRGLRMPEGYLVSKNFVQRIRHFSGLKVMVKQVKRTRPGASTGLPIKASHPHPVWIGDFG